ncbi:MAG: tetratricopeptide (TPR) repeat protein [Halieaceae bacterium]|jgi:tetratricopeptide (TPR) repeat protein
MFKPYWSLLFATLLLCSLPASAGTLEEIQHAWAHANYELSGDLQVAAFEALSQSVDQALAADAKNPELLIWNGIVKSTQAGKVGGLGALSLVKAARKSLERALKEDPSALQGSAYTSLGALYYQVPRWPIGFGDKDKARKMLMQALELNPDGLDSNYFYGDFLAQVKEYVAARAALQKALAAPGRPDRPVADKGRREEIRVLLETLPS